MAIFRAKADNDLGIKHLGIYHSWSLHKEMGGDGTNYDKFSGQILDFKEAKPRAIASFLEQVEPLLTSGFAICVVPSHDPEKKSGALHTFSAKLCQGTEREDLSGMLVRHTKIPKLAAGGRRDKEVHLNSIKVIAPSKVTGRRILLIDDVTTTGGSLEACKELLLKAGAKSVQCLALSKTG